MDRHDAPHEHAQIADHEFNQAIIDHVNTGMARASGCPFCGSRTGMYDLETEEQLYAEIQTGQKEFYCSHNPEDPAIYVPCDNCRTDLEKFTLMSITDIFKRCEIEVTEVI